MSRLLRAVSGEILDEWTDLPRSQKLYPTLVETKILVLRFAPKVNTKVAFNTTHHTKLFDQT